MHMCFIECLNPCRALHELGKVWDVGCMETAESYIDEVEQRSIDPGYEVSQVAAGTIKPKTSESGKDMCVGSGGRRVA